MGWVCRSCGEVHEELPLSFAVDFPDNYANLNRDDRENRAVINSDQCVIDQKEFYIRGCLEIPIREDNRVFLWGLWAFMWEEDFDELETCWDEEGRETRFGPYKGRLSNKLSDVYFPSIANLKVSIRLQPLGTRPLFFIDEPEHPLAMAQRDGMTLKQVEDLVSKLLH